MFVVVLVLLFARHAIDGGKSCVNGWDYTTGKGS